MSKTKSIERLLLGLLGAGLVAVASGCSKHGPPPPPPQGVARILGVDVDLPKLETEFQNASPELQGAVQQIKMDIRILKLKRATALLEKVGGDPTLTESQKKAVGDVSQQVAQVIAQQQAVRK